VEEFLEHAQFISEDLEWLLALPHDKFWCQVGMSKTQVVQVKMLLMKVLVQPNRIYNIVVLGYLHYLAWQLS